VRRVRAGLERREERHPLAGVEIQLGNAAPLGIHDELEPARRTPKRLVPQGPDELLLLRPVERTAHHHGDVDVAATVDVAAEGARAGQVDAHEVVAEQPANACDQLVEVAG
jgi:hypothetical protein